MPVVVEATLTPSRWRWLLPALNSLALAALLIWMSAGLFAWLLLPLVPWLYWQHWQSEPAAGLIRFKADSVRLINNRQAEDFLWTGQGQRSFAFMRWHLYSRDGLSIDFTVWRDSVSDASWRALNMAYRVQRAAVEREHRLAGPF